MTPLAQDALKIWEAGVAAVDSARLVQESVQAWQGGLTFLGRRSKEEEKGRASQEGHNTQQRTRLSVLLDRAASITVVGAGKAGAGMAAGLETALKKDWLSRVDGWINVPEDCVRELDRIHLHGARPAGVNEPTEAGVQGTQEILKRVSQLGPDDLCLVLISGGGSALMPAPVPGITLAEKLAVTKQLMSSGATIQELNVVRSAISAVKGGGLLRACRAGLLVSLIISDVIGDPLETIASGPTVPRRPDPTFALSVLEQASAKGATFPENVIAYLEASATSSTEEEAAATCPHENLIIGSNQTAVLAAAENARRLGFDVVQQEYDQAGVAQDQGRSLAQDLLNWKRNRSPSQGVCLISGGEPTVDLSTTSQSGKGGRNQELVLAAAEQFLQDGASGVCLLSGGTDGEDGPTDAAGGFVDDAVLEKLRSDPHAVTQSLERHDAYPLLDRVGALLKTGPTHTNVMDLRVALISP